MAEDRTLSGWPKKKLVADVRRHLSGYGIRPNQLAIWRVTWEWADQIASSYTFRRWPMPSEIATQYLLLLLVEMREYHALRLPHRAFDQQPAAVAARLGQKPLLPLLPQENGAR